MYNRILSFKKHTHALQFIKYALCGCISNSLGYGTYITCLYFGLHYTLAAFISWITGVFASAILLSSFVYHNRSPRMIIVYYLFYFTIYLVSILMLTIYKEIFNINYYYGGILNVISLPFFAFFIQKKLFSMRIIKNIDKA